jgi:hypothetical protein
MPGSIPGSSQVITKLQRSVLLIVAFVLLFLERTCSTAILRKISGFTLHQLPQHTKNLLTALDLLTAGKGVPLFNQIDITSLKKHNEFTVKCFLP